MLVEVLESVIFLEILPFGKCYYTELANEDIVFFCELRKHGIA
jgi:hypothetical protein